jgi:hypothetical protein
MAPVAGEELRAVLANDLATLVAVGSVAFRADGPYDQKLRIGDRAIHQRAADPSGAGSTKDNDGMAAHLARFDKAEGVVMLDKAQEDTRLP